MTYYTPRFWWRIPWLIRVPLLPLYVLWCLVAFLLCTFGLHLWRHVERERFAEYGPTRYHDVYDVCTRCRVVRPGSWHSQRLRGA